jgi:ATP-dependent DNA helicase RecQ
MQTVLPFKPVLKSSVVSVEEIQKVAHRYFGFTEVRQAQSQVIEAVCNGQDALVLWATGQGKSLCYQLPAFLLGKTVLIVSPLISLMNDQVLVLICITIQ